MGVDTVRIDDVVVILGVALHVEGLDVEIALFVDANNEFLRLLRVDF